MALRRGALSFPFALPPLMGDLADLLEKHADLPTSIADENLLLMAERMPPAEIWTTDRDFLVCRLPGRKRLRTIPP